MSDDRFERPIPAMSLEVVGVQFPNPDKAKSNRRFEIMLCKPGDLVELRPEPKNKADPHAIAVFSERGVQIGYLRAERAPRIRQLILEGRDIVAVFQAEVERGAWIRVTFDGSVPELPEHAPPARTPARQAKRTSPEAESYPDETYDDQGYSDPEWPDD